MAGARLPKGPPIGSDDDEPTRLVATVPKSFLKQLRHESIDRNLTLGELIQEAFSSRMMLVRRDK